MGPLHGCFSRGSDFPSEERYGSVMRRVLVSVLVLAAWSCLARSAVAFERQWHVGAGVGAAAIAEPDVKAGPVFGVHGVYGISDVFDVRASLLQSFQRYGPEPLRVTAATAGLAYKMDVIRWVPYFGVQVGYYRLRGASPPGELRTDDAGLSLDLGIDYAVKRRFALGAELRYHGFLSDPVVSLGDSPFFTGLVRAEYRWGW